MDLDIKETFMHLWKTHFNNADLPIVFYFSDRQDSSELVHASQGHRCMIADLMEVQRGKSLRFGDKSFGCFGGKRYLGFSNQIMPNFEYFLSCGIPGQMEGERYKKSPELVKEIMAKAPMMQASAEFIVFKRWDMLDEIDEPEVVIFFAHPDVLSGLCTLANFDHSDDGVIVPFGSGCSTIVQYPFLEREATSPKAILGMFDVSARPHVPEHTLSFAVPMTRFLVMIDNIGESFLSTHSWGEVRKRITAHGKG